MFKVLFGDIGSGKLFRLQYLGYSILLGLIGMGIAIAIGASIGMAEKQIGGDLQQAQAQLLAQFGIPAIVLIGALFAILFLAHLNLMAKRFRNMGLPGWWTVLAVLLAGILLSSLISQNVSNILSTLVWLALLLVPAGAFSNS